MYVKKKKLESPAKIRRRLFKLWSEKVRERDNNSCIFCGIKVGTINENDKKIRIEAHHLLSRSIHNSPLKFDIRNGISLDSLHHKFSPEESFHKAPIIMLDWYKNKYPENHKFIIDNYKIRIDIDNRVVLYEIERCLNNNELLDFNKLKEIESNNPRKIIKENIVNTMIDAKIETKKEDNGLF